MLSWSSTGATSCSASGGWSGTQAISGTARTPALATTTSFILSCTGTGGTAHASVNVGVAPNSSPFPLHTQAGKLYLLTAQGTPFFLQGDSAWSLIAQLSDSEVDTYLNDRQARGFNALLVELIEHKFSANPPKDKAGDAPFLTAGDFSTPNEVYFAHAASVIQKAADHGMVVFLTPAYMGYVGTDEGWYAEMQSNGNAKLYGYGQYLANRFAGLNNIVWVNGGDRNPADPSLMTSIIDGIRSVNTTWLHTFHGQRETSALDFVGSATNWLSLNAVYVGDSAGQKVSAQYGRAQMPAFLIEARYENADATTTAQTTRQFAYETLLAGGTGQFFGNNPIWHFDAPNPLYPYTGTWQTNLASAGSVSMQRLQSFWSTRKWWLLQPASGFATNGQAGLAGDHSFALVYTSSATTVQLSQLTGSKVTAQWFNPYTGSYTAIGEYPASGSQLFATPGNNGNGSDWLLVLDAE